MVCKGQVLHWEYRIVNGVSSGKRNLALKILQCISSSRVSIPAPALHHTMLQYKIMQIIYVEIIILRPHVFISMFLVT